RTVVVKPQSACRDALLVYVQPRTSFIQYLHDSSWLRQKETFLLLNSPSRARLLRQRQFVVLNGFRIRLHRGLKGTTESTISFPAQPRYITPARTHFHPSLWPPTAMSDCISNSKSEIGNWTQRPTPASQSAISDFEFEVQESSNFKISYLLP